ncbi:hypothetical protein KXD40_000248 [Peronospora effusa]|nr:hypothetical protein KXD40_000248 [Peronospora effusa]
MSKTHALFSGVVVDFAFLVEIQRPCSIADPVAREVGVSGVKEHSERTSATSICKGTGQSPN